MKHRWPILTIVFLAACSPTAQRDQFIRMMDAKPPGERVPDWENTKRLILREAPQVGQPAPDFTLKTRDGASEVTASRLWRDKPLVLVFGSFT